MIPRFARFRVLAWVGIASAFDSPNGQLASGSSRNPENSFQPPITITMLAVGSNLLIPPHCRALIMWESCALPNHGRCPSCWQVGRIYSSGCETPRRYDLIQLLIAYYLIWRESQKSRYDTPPKMYIIGSRARGGQLAYWYNNSSPATRLVFQNKREHKLQLSPMLMIGSTKLPHVLATQFQQVAGRYQISFVPWC